jgi:anhydro-N-acetylmuramic acid kinase
MKKYKVIGIMSGSSMDGVDLAYCEIIETNNTYTYAILCAETIPYDEKWRVRLSQLRKQFALTYVKTDVYYGHYLAALVNDFIKRNHLQPDLISSHGHTVFHYPETGITAQVGDGATIAALTGIPTVTDFRRADIALKGQGAPLVTIGDELLFSDYNACVNLGGFSNISATLANATRVAFDMGPCNIPLNRIARDLDLSYDKDGAIADKGTLNYELLSALNTIPYYKQAPPKSLNRDWINSDFWPVLRQFNSISVEDRMRTLTDHIAGTIAKTIDQLFGNNGENKKILFTGGSAHNPVLMELIRTQTDANCIVPEPFLIEYKEALIFAFLGVLRIKNIANTQHETTGASISQISGGLHGNFSTLLQNISI